MPIATRCTAPECETVTVGPFCIEHEVVVPRVFVRGRPFDVASNTAAGSATANVGPFAAMSPVVPSARRAWARREAARALR
jgi:hypothetical protein